MSEKISNGNMSHVVETKVWVFAVRAVQFVLGFVTFVLACVLDNKKDLDQFNFAVAAGVFNLVFLLYIIPTSVLPSLQVIYNVWAVLAMDFILAVFWIACMGAVAAVRNKFKGDVIGIWINNTVYITTTSQKGIMIAISIFSAFLFISYVATLIYTAVAAKRSNLLTFGSRGAATQTTAPPADGANYEMKTDIPSPSPYQAPYPASQNV